MVMDFGRSMGSPSALLQMPCMSRPSGVRDYSLCGFTVNDWDACTCHTITFPVSLDTL